MTRKAFEQLVHEGTQRIPAPFQKHLGDVALTIFQRPLERFCGQDPECIREEVAHTVWHELAHALGMLEGSLRKLERQRGRQQHARRA